MRKVPRKIPAAPRVPVSVGKGPLGSAYPKPLSGRFDDGLLRSRRTPPSGGLAERLLIAALAVFGLLLLLAFCSAA